MKKRTRKKGQARFFARLPKKILGSAKKRGKHGGVSGALGGELIEEEHGERKCRKAEAMLLRGAPVWLDVGDVNS